MPTPLTWPLAPSSPSTTLATSGGGFPAAAPLAGADDYGIDVSTFPDLDDTFAQLSGPPVVAQHVARSLADALYGVDLRQWLNDDFEPAKVFELQSAVESQCMADERIQSATAAVTQTTTHALAVTVLIALLTGKTFAMVLKVSQVSVDLLSVSVGA